MVPSSTSRNFFPTAPEYLLRKKDFLNAIEVILWIWSILNNLQKHSLLQKMGCMFLFLGIIMRLLRRLIFPICFSKFWFVVDAENYWWNIIKRVICLRRALARLTRSCTKLLNGLTTIHSLSAGVFLRSQTDNPFYNIQIIYVIETTTGCVWRMLLAVN